MEESSRLKQMLQASELKVARLTKMVNQQKAIAEARKQLEDRTTKYGQIEDEYRELFSPTGSPAQDVHHDLRQAPVSDPFLPRGSTNVKKRAREEDKEPSARVLPRKVNSECT